MRILLVEDEKLMNWSLANSASRWGFEVHRAYTGQDALKELQSNCFDIILLDYQLPDVNGLEVAQHARQAQPNVAIVLVTALQWGELKGEKTLIDAYLNKPVDMKQLHKTLEGIAKSHGPEQETPS